MCEDWWIVKCILWFMLSWHGWLHAVLSQHRMRDEKTAWWLKFNFLEIQKLHSRFVAKLRYTVYNFPSSRHQGLSRVDAAKLWRKTNNLGSCWVGMADHMLPLYLRTLTELPWARVPNWCINSYIRGWLFTIESHAPLKKRRHHQLWV